jgi:toxin ParE1/3/4
MQLKLTADAAADYDSIIEYSFHEYGEQQAIDYSSAIDESFARLTDFPHLGVAEVALRGKIRSISCRQHRIYYTIEGSTIVVRRILHQSMDIPAQMKVLDD